MEINMTRKHGEKYRQVKEEYGSGNRCNGSERDIEKVAGDTS